MNPEELPPANQVEVHEDPQMDYDPEYYKPDRKTKKRRKKKRESSFSGSEDEMLLITSRLNLVESTVTDTINQLATMNQHLAAIMLQLGCNTTSPAVIQNVSKSSTLVKTSINNTSIDDHITASSSINNIEINHTLINGHAVNDVLEDLTSVPEPSVPVTYNTSFPPLPSITSNPSNSYSSNLASNIPASKPATSFGPVGSGITTRTPAINRPSTSTSSSAPTSLPALFTYDLDIKKFIMHCKTANIVSYLIKKISDNCHKITFKSKSERCSIIELFTSTNVQFYSFTPKDELLSHLVLKDLPIGMNEVDIQEELSLRNLSHLVQKVTPFTNNKYNYFILSLSPGTPLSPFLSLSKIGHAIVSFERLKKKTITQCYRCQRFGHLSVNCNLTSRCVKCGKHHSTPSECLIPAGSPPQLLFCTLCNVHGHTPRYSACPARLNYIKNKSTTQLSSVAQVSDLTSQNPPTSMRGRTSYATIASNSLPKTPVPHLTTTKPAATPKPTVPTDIFMELDQMAIETFGCDFQKLLLNFKPFFSQYQSTTSISDKRKLFTNFLFAISS